MTRQSFHLGVEYTTLQDSYERFYNVVEEIKVDSFHVVCPHCAVFASMKRDAEVCRNTGVIDGIFSCPNCHNSVFVQARYDSDAIIDGISDASNVAFNEIETQSFPAEIALVYPRRREIVVPPEVPSPYSEDYREAVLISDLSPKASAALSRRILQTILRNEYQIQHHSLAREIEDFINSPKIPTYLADAVDAVRNIGNIAAHPLKDTNTGEIIEVEPGEAEWLLEVLASLFDFTFVQPKRLEEKKSDLNQKLQAIGKPPMKEKK